MSRVSFVHRCQARADVPLWKGYNLSCVLTNNVDEKSSSCSKKITYGKLFIKAVYCLCFTDCSKKKSVNTGKISELQQDIATIKCDIDAVILQQKVTDKKISNVIKLKEETKEDLEKAKVKREALSLEMVDLQQGKYIWFTWIAKFWISIVLFHPQSNLILIPFWRFQK